MLYYARIETLRTLRNKRYAIFVVVFPVALYLINSGIYGEQTAAGGVRQSVYLMVSMACYGALAAAMMSTALPWAQERSSGWSDQLRVTPLPGWAVIAVKAGAALLLVLPALALVFAAAVVVAGVSLPAGQWALLVPALWLGTIPFAALGLAIGSLLPPDAAQPAAVAVMFGLSLAGGLWFPVEIMSGPLRAVAAATPVYRYAELGWSVVAGGGLPAAGLLSVLAWAVALGAAAVHAFRRATVRS